MTIGPSLAVGLTLFLCPVAALTQPHGEADAATPYAGLQARAIAALSEADIEELRRGGDWGLA